MVNSWTEPYTSHGGDGTRSMLAERFVEGQLRRWDDGGWAFHQTNWGLGTDVVICILYTLYIHIYIYIYCRICLLDIYIYY